MTTQQALFELDIAREVFLPMKINPTDVKAREILQHAALLTVLHDNDTARTTYLDTVPLSMLCVITSVSVRGLLMDLTAVEFIACCITMAENLEIHARDKEMAHIKVGDSFGDEA